MLTVDIITIFPNMFGPVLSESIIQRAQDKKKARIRVHDLRAYTHDKYRKVDDRPFGGGPGMVMSAQPIFEAVKDIKKRRKAKVILLTASGQPYTQKVARKLAKERNLILICGHYEGVDHRVESQIADECYSVGDYVLTGGEIPALVVVDSVVRLLPGVVGKETSLDEESYEHGLLEYPHYTRPAEFKGEKVPEVLLSGHHKEIAAWRKKQSEARTKKLRPDMWKEYKR